MAIQEKIRNSVGAAPPFRPTWWLPEGHSQTLWRKFGPAVKVTHRRERMELGDGDFIDLDWCDSDPAASRVGPIVAIIHGLCGCSQSSYVLALQAQLHQHHITSVALNLRGCSGDFNRKAVAYHSGISRDLDEVINYLRDHHPGRSLVPVGYSLGGNVLLKWLGEGRDYTAIDCAVAVSVPFLLDYCSRAMLSGLSRFYGAYFVNRLKKDLLAKRQHFQQQNLDAELAILKSLGVIENIRTIWEFDDRVTAPLHGFDSAEHYYRLSSSRQFIPAISCETLLIQSSNDPLIPVNALPDAGSLPANVHLDLHRQGGHVGFSAGVRDDWLERHIAGFILA